MRLDQYLVENNYFETRSKAKAAIDEGHVYINDKKCTKASFDIKGDEKIELKDVCPYVSRGGYKLLGAIQKFNLDFKDKIVLDIGSSTGGFTDCSIQNGAKLVYAVDVGTNQLHDSLRNNPKVISMENTNILDLDINTLNPRPNILVMDVSFVSIEYLLPGINNFILDDTIFVSLIKPQFEVGNIKIKNGIVKDRVTHIKIIENVRLELNKYGLDIFKLTPSPILGGSGNKEFLALIKRGINPDLNIIKSIEE
jgi:23S rRNA (cytidine1920-2'-O)/16S rRNA (cytidine1409-2'-O)-methyltransferase